MIDEIYFADTETCGFHGPIVLIQYAQGVDGAVQRHNVWLEPIIDTLRLIEDMCDKGFIGFNNTFDWFHICQLYTTLLLLGEKVGFDSIPEDHIDEYAELEPLGRDGPCLKPRHTLDLMLYVRKGPYQSTMDRKDIRIRKVPRALGIKLADELNKRIPLPDIYFSRQKDTKRRWTVSDRTDDPDFVNVELRFKPSSALKVLVTHALNIKEDDVLKFSQIEVKAKFRPIEFGFAPFAKAVSSQEKGWFVELKGTTKKKKGWAWPGVISHHIRHWAYDKFAIKYAVKDVEYLQQLYKHFDCPELDDDDSVLACMVGAVRWRGYAVDMEKLLKLREEARVRSEAAPKAPKHVKHYLGEVLDDFERDVIKGSTKKVILEDLSKWKNDDDTPHPAAIRAKACLLARQATHEIANLDKIILAKRFHVSLKVIGSLSSRMSGTDGINALGIQHEKKIRQCFTLALPDTILTGGDFDAFEVGIADADYDDAKMRQQLLTCFNCKCARTIDEIDDEYCPTCHKAQAKCKKHNVKGLIDRNDPICCPDCEIEDTRRKIHGLFAIALNEGKLDYDQILATKGTADDQYDKGKKGVFSQFYGGDENTIVDRIGCDIEVAKAAVAYFKREYEGVGRALERNYEKFCSMRQPGGIGTQVIWHDPHEYAESLNGFRRYFTLENTICKVLFDLANDPPEDWLKIKITCARRDRVQTVSGATRSAVFGAAFQIQARNMRAACNHRIQSTGAIETKRLQVRIWKLQPVGIREWIVQPFSIHDEVLCPCKPEFAEPVASIVSSFIKERRSLIPLLKMKYLTKMGSWADK